MASLASVVILALCLCSVLAEHAHHKEEYAHTKPHYEFKYSVHDAHTGDIKDQWETRDGDVVKGSYSLVEPDGTLRQVDYTSDGKNGFNAHVQKTGKAVHPYHHEGYKSQQGHSQEGHSQEGHF